MITGNGLLSLRKKDLENQKIPALGFVKTYFAHKATAGQTGINLSALTTPSEMMANGFSQPTVSQLASAQLLFFQNNLRLESSARGLLQKGLSYVVATSTQINFLGFTALEGEIFTGTIDYNAQTGIKMVDASAQPVTGVLPAGATDFNIGQVFQINKYPSTQCGAVLVYNDGILQFRNSGNSATVFDGNFYEVNNGGGSFSVIRFNQSEPTKLRNILVVPNGLLTERPDGSMMAVIENLQGQINNMASFVAVATGNPVSLILGATPSNVDLKSFGDQVLNQGQRLSALEFFGLQFGTWTPTMVSVANLSGTPGPNSNWVYIKLGNLVFCMGSAALDPVSPGVLTQIDISNLPVQPSVNFSSNTDNGTGLGCASDFAGSMQAFSVNGTKNMRVYWTPSDVSNRNYTIFFYYKI